jgi:hypothetical protein
LAIFFIAAWNVVIDLAFYIPANIGCVDYADLAIKHFRQQERSVSDKP